MKQIIVAFALALTGATPAFGQSAAWVDAQKAVLLEVYVSQACASCVMASSVIDEVSAGGDVLVLSFPVDYWDYRGWQDTFARPEHKYRQDGYRQKLSNSRLYTPQAVVHGVRDVRADKKPALQNAVLSAASDSYVPISATMTGREVQIRLPRHAVGRELEIWVAPYDPGDSVVRVKAGENRGKTLRFRNVVKGLVHAGVWRGEAGLLTVTLPDDAAAEACAIIVQERGTGPVVAVANIL